MTTTGIHGRPGHRAPGVPTEPGDAALGGLHNEANTTVLVEVVVLRRCADGALAYRMVGVRRPPMMSPDQAALQAAAGVVSDCQQAARARWRRR